MKQKFPYILMALGVLLLGVLLVAGLLNKKKTFDPRITLRANDKIPYGFYVAYTLLPKVFPDALIQKETNSPLLWQQGDTAKTPEAKILVCADLNAEEDELNELTAYAHRGNYVFIIAHDLSYDASKYFHTEQYDYVYNNPNDDSLQLALEQPPFSNGNSFVYPGRRFESYFSNIDTGSTMVLGRGTKNGVDFIGFKTGKGGIFIHLAPLAFSNYFLLHKKNIGYYQNALAVLPPTVSKVVWNDYYLTKQKRQESEPSWFRVLMKNPSFRWGLLTVIAALLLYVLIEMKRRQRMIPLWEMPKNDSLDFVKTIGRLYYDKSDHKNLAKKMGAYFLEHIRTQYKLATHTIDDDFIQAVHRKTAYPEAGLKKITGFIQYSEQAKSVTETELADFYKQLELFYQTT